MKIPELQQTSIQDCCTERQLLLLEKINIFTCEDIICYFPFRYEDRSKTYTLAEALQSDKSCTVEVTIIDHQFFFWNNKRQAKIIVQDSTSSAELVAFNMRAINKMMPIGQKFYIYGKFEFRFNKIQTSHFEYESYEKMGNINSSLGKLLPIYRLTDGLSNKEFHKIMRKIFTLHEKNILDPIPLYFLTSRNLFSKQEMLKQLHFPESSLQIEKARVRGAYEEFLCTRISLELTKTQETKQTKPHSYESISIVDKLKTILPFKMTKAQDRVIGEITYDLKKSHSMHRLLQGDVGSGKTVVALSALTIAASNNLQAAFLSPTEILAFQHYEKIKPIADQLNISCELLTGSISTKNRQPILSGLKDGALSIVIGTHALFQKEVEYHNLSLVIIDEQHKFGVEQRSTIIKKGLHPDILAMTATPIPRTITLALYGDLDISIIDELPSGRQHIVTKHITKNHYPKLIDHLQKELHKNRQIFVICPLIEDNEKLENVCSVEEVKSEFQKLLPEFCIEMVHGKMCQDNKDDIMKKFAENQIHVLIATTVIEVGIDIPNASTIIIKNSERFGLAQLHQLRGRVGRGIHKSYCFLVTDDYNSNDRLNILCESNDGFKIAEEDLKIRGPGEMLGTKQTGIPCFKLADFTKDQNILHTAISDAQLILNRDPSLELPKHSTLKTFIILEHGVRIFSG